jgi:hypothetical protein
MTMAITGIHGLFYSSMPEALRSTLRDVMGWDYVDAGDGWLIFRLPPAELGVHPGESPHHELSFMCDDLEGTMAELRIKGVEVHGDVENRGFGRTVTLVLPGDVEVLLYEPNHRTAV